MPLIVEIAPNVDGPILNSNWVDVSEYVEVSSVSSLREGLDFNDFDVGVVRNDNIKLVLNNSEGLFSEAGEANSIFDFKRDGSAVRISYRYTYRAARVGTAVAGSLTDARLSPRVTIFVGILSGDSVVINAREKKVTFEVLSVLSILDREVVDTPANFTGDSASNAIDTILKTSPFDKYTNATPIINVTNDPIVDQGSAIADTSNRSALNNLIKITNSVLTLSYPENSINAAQYGRVQVEVRNRTAKPQIVKRFYNQYSSQGVENIISLDETRSGINRTLNQITYDDGNRVIRNQSSINRNGLRSFDISSGLITDPQKQFKIIEDYLVEFGEPRQELTFTVPLTYDSLDIKLLDRVTIDYALNLTEDPLVAARYGRATYGTSTYASVDSGFFFSGSTPLKVYEKRVNFKNGTIVLKTRVA